MSQTSRKIYHVLCSPEEALRRLFSVVDVRPLGVEEVDIMSAVGRVLAEDVYSPIDVPPFDRATMDGYAVRAEDTYGSYDYRPVRLRVVGKVDAGDWPSISIERGKCVEIATGAPLPAGANAVLMVEHTKRVGDEIYVYKPVSPGENVAFAGSDVAAGDLVLRRCAKITSREVALLAAIGVDKVKVFRRPRVAIISTGNELRSPGERLELGKIYDVNSYALAAALLELGADPHVIGIVRDDIDELKDAISRSVREFDLVLVSGGTSAGTSDLVYRVLDELGRPGVIVHGLQVRPGKPTVIAAVDNKIVIGLPGYPNSALMVFNLIVRPIISRMLCTEFVDDVCSARLAVRIRNESGRRWLLPVALVHKRGELVAYPLHSAPGTISTLAYADGFVEIPESVEYVDEGEIVNVKLFGKARPADLYIIGSHDIGLDVLISMMPKDITVKCINVGSLNGILAVKRGEADIAGTHLVDEETGEYNVPYVKRYDIRNAVLVRGYMREQGIIVRKGNPKRITSIEDFLREDVRIVNRNRGAGTRVLLDLKLKEIASKLNLSFEDVVRRVKGYTYEVRTHTAVAAAVHQGKADAGLGIRSAAKLYDLDFIPIAWEHYDFLISKPSLEKRVVKEFLRVLKSNEFKERLLSLTGYKVPEDIGEIVYES